VSADSGHAQLAALGAEASRRLATPLVERLTVGMENRLAARRTTIATAGQERSRLVSPHPFEVLPSPGNDASPEALRKLPWLTPRRTSNSKSAQANRV